MPSRTTPINNLEIFILQIDETLISINIQVRVDLGVMAIKAHSTL